MNFYILFEFFWLFAFILAFWHCSKKKSIANALIFLVPAFVWGYLAEFTGVYLWKIYEYPVNYIMILFGIPLGIAFGWATIIYFGYYITTKYLRVKQRLALDIDSALISTLFDFIILEPLALVYQFWIWKQNDFWFGAPLFNFIGWFLVITIYLLTYQYISKKYVNKKQQAIYFILALIPAFIILQLATCIYLSLFGWF